MNLAYRYVLISLMLARINSIGPELKLPIGFPIGHTEVDRAFVWPPTMRNLDDPSLPNFCARLDAGGFSFSFSKSGRCCYVTKLHLRQRPGIYLDNLDFSRFKVISSNEAYLLSSNWLGKLEVDVKKLEKTAPPTVEQAFVWSSTNSNVKKYLHWYSIYWGKENSPIASVWLDGITKELLKLRLEDDSLSKAPAIGVSNVTELLKISDDEFVKYSDLQRRELVTRYGCSLTNLDQMRKEKASWNPSMSKIGVAH